MPNISDNMWNGVMGTLLYVPMLNLLVFFYQLIPTQDLGLAIVALTLLIRIILHPSYAGSLRSQHDLQRIQPYVDKIRQELKDDPTAQSKAIMEIYKEHKVSPLGSCLPLIIQLPIVIALYRVFIAGLNDASLTHLYSWFPNPPSTLHPIFLGVIDLAHPNLYMAVMAGVVQLLQSLVTQRYTPAPKIAGPLNMQMITYIFPVITVVIAVTLPAALSLYWTASTAIMLLQQLIIYRSFARAEHKIIDTTRHADR